GRPGEELSYIDWLHLVDPLQTVLRQRLVVFLESANARRQIAIIVLEDLIAPVGANFRFLLAEPVPPLPGRHPVVEPPRLDFQYFPEGIDRGDDFFQPRGDAARENLVSHPPHVAQILSLAGNEVAQDRLQPKVAAGGRPLVREAKVASVGG